MDAGRVRALLDGTVPELMARARVPGVAIGVLAGAESVAIGFGVTGVEHPLPVDAHTLFQIGSVSKTFTAALCMALVERGRLALDDPVPRHLPGFRLGAPGLAERSWGSLEGKPRKLRVRSAPPPDAESYEAFAARTLAALAGVEARGKPLIVAHSGTFRVLCRTLGVAEPAEQVANCSPVRFTPPSRAGGKWSLEIL